MWIVVEAAQAPQAIEKGQAHRGFFVEEGAHDPGVV